MNIAIATLRNRIEKLNKEYKEVEKTLEEPELIADYYFSMNDLINITNECTELVHAIRILENHNYITKE